MNHRIVGATAAVFLHTWMNNFNNKIWEIIEIIVHKLVSVIISFITFSKPWEPGGSFTVSTPQHHLFFTFHAIPKTPYSPRPTLTSSISPFSLPNPTSPPPHVLSNTHSPHIHSFHPPRQTPDDGCSLESDVVVASLETIHATLSLLILLRTLKLSFSPSPPQP